MSQYQTGELFPRGRQLQPHMVEDSVQSIGQALSVMGSPDSRLTSQEDLDIRL